MTTEPTTKTNHMATVALALAICGLLLLLVILLLYFHLQAATKDAREQGLPFIVSCFTLPPVLGLVSVVLAHVTRRRLGNAPGTAGKGIAKAAMIVGCVTIASTAATLWLTSAVLLLCLWGKQ